MKMKHETDQQVKSSGPMMYKKLIIMILLSFIAMYILMYAMVDKLTNVIPNVNQFYMAGLMTMPMLIIELAVMGSMYVEKGLRIILLSSGFAGLIVFFLCIHQQVGVSDKQFLKSMIPHHSAAVLMVEKASLSDPEIKKLANKILTNQQAEIQQMKAKLSALEK